MRFLFLVALLCSSLFSCAQCDSTLQLDDTTRRLAINLLREFSNKTRLAELIANGGSSEQTVSSLERFPAKPVAEIYRNYTLTQIAALETELSQHEHFIYKPIEEKTKVVAGQFSAACQSYEADGDLDHFEKQFLKTGNELVSLQKMVLRIINSKLEEKLKPVNYRVGRNWVYDMFDRLNGLFLGTQSGTLFKSSEYSQVNKMYSLMQALEKIEHVQPTDEQTKANVDKLKMLLYKLRKVYQLNSIASVPNHYLNTDNISPYSYEAILRLVQLMGSAQNFGQQFNPLMTMFRSWMNFFSGGNIFTSLMNPFGDGSNTGNNQPTSPKYNAKKLRALIKMLEENQSIRQQQIEQNRQKAALESLIKNQNKQQAQISEILQALANQQTTSAPAVNQTWKPWVPPSARPTGWPSARPTFVPSVNNPANVLQKLKEQRRHLNELLQELSKPIPNQPGTGPSLWPNLFPGTGSSVTTNRPAAGNTNTPTNDLMQAQQALMGIMKNITPLINIMGQSGMVSAPKVEKSKFQLLDILNAVNNREIDETSDVEDKGKELQRVEKLGEKLESVLDSIIDEAEKKNGRL